MKQHIVWVCLLAFAAPGVHGQAVQPVIEQPDCSFFFSLTTTTGRFPTAGYDNRFKGCVTWAVTYFNAGFTPVSLELQSAPDSSGAAGSWVSFAGTVVAGTNPMTSTTQTFMVASGYNPWISVKNNSTGAGTITGFAYGFQAPPLTYTTTGAGVQDVNLEQVNGAAISLGQALMSASLPVAIASNQGNVPFNLAAVAGTATVTGGVGGSVGVGGVGAAGAAVTGNPLLGGGSDGTNARFWRADTQGNQMQYLGCNASATVALSGTGLTEIVAGTASQIIKVCKIFVTSASGGAPVVNTFSIARATVTSCGTATVLAAPTAVTGFDLDFGGALQSGSGQSICISESVANSDVVTITYQKAAF